MTATHKQLSNFNKNFNYLLIGVLFLYCFIQIKLIHSMILVQHLSPIFDESSNENWIEGKQKTF